MVLIRKSERRPVNVLEIWGSPMDAFEPNAVVIDSDRSVVFVYSGAIPISTRSSKGLYPRVGVFNSRRV
jgi:hypothetical protein